MRNYFIQSAFGFALKESMKSLKGSIASLEDQWFYEAILQALKAIGRTSPNPPVGSVVVQNNQIVGLGFTSPIGKAHAEINALKQAGALSQNATLFSTLEPCCHYGRTPPCTDAIIKAGIKKVVIGVKDPNPAVDGNGIRVLQKANIEVVIRKPDILKNQAELLIAPFQKSIAKRLPWVICKVATSLDGRVANKIGVRSEVSHLASKNVVHALRNYVDAIMVGSNTVVIDDPSLTVRHFKSHDGKNPLRIVLDGVLKTDIRNAVYDAQLSSKAYVFHTELAKPAKQDEFDKAHIKRIEIKSKDNHVSLQAALEKAFQLGVNSILVECGPDLFFQFVEEKLFDEIWWFTSPKVFGSSGPNALEKTISPPIFDDAIWEKPILLDEDVLFVGKHRG